MSKPSTIHAWKCWLWLAAGLWLCLPNLAQAGERYAFLVGVKEYDKAELTSLQYTEEDVTALADVLRGSGYPEGNIVLMTQTVGARKARFLPLAKNIQQELSLLLKELTAEDTIVVAFSGHGVQFKGEDEAFFCPADAQLRDRATLVSLGTVYKSLAKCRANTKVLFVDACRNDPQSKISKAAREVVLEPAGRLPSAPLPGGIAAFFSCSDTEQSFEDPGLEHGVFMNYVVKALKGAADSDKDQEVTLAELEQYTVRQVQRHVRKEFGRSQTPERQGTTRGLPVLAVLSPDSSSVAESDVAVPQTPSGRPAPPAEEADPRRVDFGGMRYELLGDEEAEVRASNRSSKQTVFTVRFSERPIGLALPSDGARLCCATNTKVHMLDAGTGQELWSYENAEGFVPATVSFVDEGRKVRVVGEDDEERSYDAATGRLLE